MVTIDLKIYSSENLPESKDIDYNTKQFKFSDGISSSLLMVVSWSCILQCRNRCPEIDKVLHLWQEY